MANPSIKVLGVYNLPYDDQLLKEQADVLYGATLKGAARKEAERRCRQQLSSTVLIEALVQDRDARFNVTDFTLPQLGVPPDSWQTAWAETFLSVDGETRLKTLWPDPPKDQSFRVAFFMHYWQIDIQLNSTYGPISCPLPQEMPERLRKLAPYQVLD